MTSKPALDDIFQLLNRHVHISYGVFEKLSLYHGLLLTWQTKMNLVGSETIKDTWQRHFLDSLQLLKFMPDPAVTIVDIGSGSGFPGMALAVAGAGDVHLIEKDAKKVAFLREVARVTKTNVTINHGRIEDQPSIDAKIVIARACAPLGTLLALTFPQVSHGTICLFPKGKNWSNEVEGAKEHWMFNYSVIPSVTDNQGVILKLTHVARRL
ncbi:MAG: 16S rRNA (guanine(527)-N(7))-methyltransferase RsmG [Pseudomonadota bacterium]|nr:16S rRNA (guanine(527)-N(7))-methyltransferase RsmG [Pseudomonadota bacterium]MDE3036975.1 16S rRNA (guanine(527)-N(7))-methyltransferase RsmG [Pseudomonadota bacterium]